MRTLLLLLVGAMLLFAGCTASDTSNVTPEPGATLDATALTEGVTVGGVLYVLNDATTRTRIGEETAANGTFLVLRMGVRNTRDDTATIAADQFTVEAGSTPYGVSGDAAVALQENGEDAVLDRQRIDPGFQTQTVLAFDVPVQETYTLAITQNGEAVQAELAP